MALSGLPVAHAKELGNSWSELQVESSQRQQLGVVVVEVDRQPVRVSQTETALVEVEVEEAGVARPQKLEVEVDHIFGHGAAPVVMVLHQFSCVGLVGSPLQKNPSPQIPCWFLS